MTRKEQLKTMSLEELEQQKKFILNGRISFEDQKHSAEIDDEIRLRKAQEREKNVCTCQGVNELNERINMISETGNANAKIFAERIALTRKELEEQQRFIEDLKNDAVINNERLERQAETLDVIFNNYNSQHEKILKLEAAIKDLRHYESVLVESGRFEQYAKYVEDFNKFLEMKDPRSLSNKQDNRKEAAKARAENHRLSRILDLTEDIEESIGGLKRYMKEKDRALKFLIFVDTIITASLMAVMYKYILLI